MLPRWVILDTQDEVQLCLSTIASVRGCDLTIDDVISELLACAMNRDTAEDDFLKYIAKIRHQYRDKLSPRDLDKVTVAIGDLGTEVLKKLREHDLYTQHGVLWFEYYSLFQYNIVLQNMFDAEESHEVPERSD